MTSTARLAASIDMTRSLVSQLKHCMPGGDEESRPTTRLNALTSYVESGFRDRPRQKILVLVSLFLIPGAAVFGSTHARTHTHPGTAHTHTRTRAHAHTHPRSNITTHTYSGGAQVFVALISQQSHLLLTVFTVVRDLVTGLGAFTTFFW